MDHDKQSNSGFRNVLNGGAASLAMGVALLSAGAMGQVVPQTPAVDEASKGQNTDEIVVTGTLIRNPNLTLATPVNVQTSNEIELRQANVAEDLLREVPGIVPSIGSAVNNGNGGASYLDLRGLGANRNLVLIDGGRTVPANGFASAGTSGAVDLNNIPLALIDRVDVITGGAASTYGADAIAGVANFVIKRNFTGIEAKASQQLTEQGDGHYERFDLTVGGNFADDKGNAVISIGYQKADPVYQGDRGFSTNNLDSYDGSAGGSSTTTPSTFSLPGQGSNHQVVPDGTLYAGTNLAPGGAGTTHKYYIPFNFNPYNIFQTPFNRYNIFGQANYKASDAVEVYTRGMFTQNEVKTVIAPSGVFGQLVTIPLSNPYLPIGARNQFCAASGITPAQCDAAALSPGPTLANGAVDPNYRTVNTILKRRTVEEGSRISDYTTTVFDYRAGVRGAIGEHLHYDIFGDYGRSENRQQILGYVGVSRVRQALLATNTTTCLDPTGNCVPLNVFGPTGSINAAQAAFINEQSTTAQRTSLLQAGGHLNGDLGFASPFATSPINFAAGAEYREYRASQLADTLAQTAGELGGAGGAVIPVTGGYNVVEGFGEVAVPLIEDKPFFKSLILQAGVRYSSYTLSGAPGGYNTTTYKGGGTWEPVGGFKLRGTYERSVRAPNLFELFSPPVTGLTNLKTDACSGNKPVGNAILTAICLAQGAPANTIGNIADPSAGQPNETSGGNVKLQPEKADTFTAGVIVTPDKYVRGLSLTVDYYHIVLNGAITVPTVGDALGACFNNQTAASATSTACTLIRRNPTTGGLDGDPATTPGIFLGYSNQGRILTNGIDATIDYRHNLGPGKIDVGFTGNYTFQSKFKANAADPNGLNRECVGYYSQNCSFTGSLQPKYQWSQRTTLSYEAIDLTVLWRHIAPFNQEPDDIVNVNGPAFSGNGQNFGHISSYDYFDIGVRYSISNNLRLIVSALNITDKLPPVVGSTIGSTTFNSGNTYPSTYDALGRRYVATVSLKY